MEGDKERGDAVGSPAGGSEHTSYERLERLGKGSWWALGVALLVLAAFLLLARFGAFIIPSLIGIVLATTLSPVVSFLARRRVPRLAAAAFISLFIVAGLVVLAWGIVAIVVDQSPQIWNTLKSGAGQVDQWLGHLGAARGTLDRIRQAGSSLQHGAVTGVLPLALKGVRALYDLVVAVFLAAGFAFFFLWEGPDVRRFVSRHLAQPEDVGLRITASLVRTTRRYVAGLSIIGASQAVIVGATAAIAGVSAWPVIAFVIFLGNFIPYIGGLIAGVFAVLLTLGSQGPGPALAVLIAIVIAYFAGSHLGAFAIGEAIRLPVTAVFVLTMAGAATAGVFGAAAAAPLARLAIDAHDIIGAHSEAAADPAGAEAAPEPPA
jgi:predicted PurR-regulated permease PerM